MLNELKESFEKASVELAAAEQELIVARRKLNEADGRMAKACRRRYEASKAFDDYLFTQEIDYYQI